MPESPDKLFVDQAYDTAVELAGKRYVKVSFTYAGTRYEVSPMRLGRKIYDLECEIKQLRKELAYEANEKEEWQKRAWGNLEQQHKHSLPLLPSQMGFKTHKEYEEYVRDNFASKVYTQHSLPDIQKIQADANMALDELTAETERLGLYDTPAKTSGDNT